MLIAVLLSMTIGPPPLMAAGVSAFGTPAAQASADVTTKPKAEQKAEQ